MTEHLRLSKERHWSRGRSFATKTRRRQPRGASNSRSLVQGKVEGRRSRIGHFRAYSQSKLWCTSSDVARIGKCDSEDRICCTLAALLACKDVMGSRLTVTSGRRAVTAAF